uniref:Uncharacterized protein n=1 Tax=Romanomermis culicivorax TaxID=13658 RepID=A0A915K5I8_ROMCU
APSLISSAAEGGRKWTPAVSGGGDQSFAGPSCSLQSRSSLATTDLRLPPVAESSEPASEVREVSSSSGSADEEAWPGAAPAAAAAPDGSSDKRRTTESLSYPMATTVVSAFDVTTAAHNSQDVNAASADILSSDSNTSMSLSDKEEIPKSFASIEQPQWVSPNLADDDIHRLHQTRSSSSELNSTSYGANLTVESAAANVDDEHFTPLEHNDTQNLYSRKPFVMQHCSSYNGSIPFHHNFDATLDLT